MVQVRLQVPEAVLVAATETPAKFWGWISSISQSTCAEKGDGPANPAGIWCAPDESAGWEALVIRMVVFDVP